MKSIKIKVPAYPATHGQYCVYDGVSLLLEKGWVIAHSTRKAHYLYPPPDVPVDAIVSIEVPDEHEIESLRDLLHRERSPYSGELEGWPVKYEPSV
jgi:hypothetical protein